MTDSTDNAEDVSGDIARYAAEAVAAIDLLAARAPARADRDDLAALAAGVIAMAAAFTAAIRGQVVAVGADPAAVETAIRRALTPAQVAQLAARLGS